LGVSPCQAVRASRFSRRLGQGAGTPLLASMFLLLSSPHASIAVRSPCD
jgi:hypothetical protein